VLFVWLSTVWLSGLCYFMARRRAAPLLSRGLCQVEVWFLGMWSSWSCARLTLARRPWLPDSFSPWLWGLYLGPFSAVRCAGAWLSCDGLSGFCLPYLMGVTGCPGPGAFPVCSLSLERVWLRHPLPITIHNSHGTFGI